MSSRSEAPTAKRRWLMGALRVLGTALAFGFLFVTVDRAALSDAIARISPASFALGVALVLGVVALGTLRFLLLLRAYGATKLPGFGSAFALYLVGLFYNLYLPGAVSGDLLRGVVSREAFEDLPGATTRGVAVVFVERVLGLVGLLGLGAIATLSRPDGGFAATALSLLALVATAGAAGGLALGRRLAPRLPGPLGRAAASLPSLVSVSPLLVVAALSVLVHLLLATAGHVFLASLAPDLRFVDSATFFPIGSAMAFVPITMAGAGLREATLVGLFAAVRVPEAAVLAASLALFASQLFVGALGGLYHALSGLRRPANQT